MTMKAYMGLPEMLGDIPLYPIRVIEWEEFDEVGVRFLSIGDKYIENRVKVNVEVYHYLMYLILQNLKKGSDKDMKDFVRMLELVTRDTVEPVYDIDLNLCIFVIGGDEKKIISSKNYNEFREIVNAQNLIFEPLTAKDDLSNSIIQKNLKRRGKNATPTDSTAMFAVVTTLGSGVADSEMTYYCMRAKYEVISRQIRNNLHSMAIVQGGEVELIEMAKRLSIEENPYSVENIFTQHNMSGDHTI